MFDYLANDRDVKRRMFVAQLWLFCVVLKPGANLWLLNEEAWVVPTNYAFVTFVSLAASHACA